jgi:hypothetical protein
VLVERVSDPAHRLEGEDPVTADLARSRQWCAAYQRIVDYKLQLLDMSRRFVDVSDPVVGQAIRESDIILIEVQLSRFEQKRDYWKLRVSELAGRRGAEA